MAASSSGVASVELACGGGRRHLDGRLRLVGLERARGVDVSSESSICNILDGSSSLALNVSSERIPVDRERMLAGERASPESNASPENRLNERAIRDSE